ncbi:acylphosphatase [uncultured Gemmiger sp.]|uniref:acylphosphatase n=1 Tax=uncultured Gemmiger sp. TaxID=1623490 RepID=UPI0025D354B0|nr:acylphosphatase [uncultured Gemmiger sp.]
MERRQYRFFGRVQGVGFRYRAYYTASRLGLTGWVENEPDGSVLLEAQGEADDLERLVNDLRTTSRWIMIENFTCRERPLDPEERSFRVRDSYGY